MGTGRPKDGRPFDMGARRVLNRSTLAAMCLMGTDAPKAGQAPPTTRELPGMAIGDKAP